MFKLVAVILALAAGGIEPTGIEFKSRASFPDKERCEAFKDSAEAHQEEVKAVLAKKSEEDGVQYSVKFECRAFDDGSI